MAETMITDCDDTINIYEFVQRLDSLHFSLYQKLKQARGLSDIGNHYRHDNVFKSDTYYLFPCLSAMLRGMTTLAEEIKQTEDALLEEIECFLRSKRGR